MKKSLLLISLYIVLIQAVWMDGNENSLPVRSKKQIHQDWVLQAHKKYASISSDSSEAMMFYGVTQKVIQQGFQLTAYLKEQGVETGIIYNDLKVAEKKLAGFSKKSVSREIFQIYDSVRETIRKISFRNPVIDFKDILFVKKSPGVLAHLSDQNYGWWSRPGGGIFLLKNFASENPDLVCLTTGWPEGTFSCPDLSYDATKILFSYCKFYPELFFARKLSKDSLPEECFNHIYEMNIDGTGLHQITFGKYEDIEPRYLPNDDIVFVSTRKGQFLQCSKQNSMLTMKDNLPDSYVRCGGDAYRPVPVYNLHRMDRQGKNIFPISSFESFEWNPSLLNDGRIVYTRWDYIDRNNGNTFSLWATNQDGTNAQLLYGNYTIRPQAKMEPRAIPNSNKIILTAAAHHSNTGGSLILFDRTKGMEGSLPITRLTPEVPFPETETNVNMFYANPYPLSEEFYFVSWSKDKLPPHRWQYKPGWTDNPENAQGLYLYDIFGNLELIFRDDKISSMYPIPVRTRVKPPVHPSVVNLDGKQEGAFYIQNIYTGLTRVEKGTIDRLRVIGVVPKTQFSMNRPTLGPSQEEPGKYVIGTTKIYDDGSAYFKIPSGVPVFFQALDKQGHAIQTMRTLTYVQPNETLSCIGCHESRDLIPASGYGTMAISKPPDILMTEPEGSWPLSYDLLVQPVLDRICVKCHQYGDEEIASKFDLTKGNSYQKLLSFADNDLENLVFERDSSIVGHCPSLSSKLLKKICTHNDLEINKEDFYRLMLWMDVYAQTTGSFSDKQENDLKAFKVELIKQGLVK